MTTDRDPTIGALLERLEGPPPPSPAFWDDLREQLEHGRRVVELRPVPPGGTRPDRTTALRRRVLAAVAAAAVIAAGVYGVTRSGGHHDQDRLRVPATNPPQISPTTTVEGTPPAGAGSTTPGAAHSDSVVQSTVKTWIQAVKLGNSDLAWSLVGPQSRANVDRSSFDSMFHDLSTTWAPFAREDLVRIAYPLGPDNKVWVVYLALPDGSQAQAIGAGEATATNYVEPFVPGTALSLVSFPLDGASAGSPKIGSGDTIQVHLDADAKGSVLAFDGQAIAASSLTRDATGAITSVSSRGLRAGHHDILVAEVTSDGTLAIVDQSFTVTAG